MKKRLKIFIIVVIIILLVVLISKIFYEKYKSKVQEEKMIEVVEHYRSNLEELPRKLPVEEAIERGYFVYDCINEKVYNKDVLERFVKNTEINAKNRIADEIIIVIYNINNDPSIYNVGYNFLEGVGYVLATDFTRVDLYKTELADSNGYIKDWEQYTKINVNTDIPGEYYGITVYEDEGISAGIISLTLYADENDMNLGEKQYKDIEIGRYLLDTKIQNADDINVGVNDNTDNGSFIRTYNVLNIADSNDENYIYLTIRQFQFEEVETVKVERSLAKSVKKNKNYEFEFQYTNKNVEDEIKSIFENTILKSIKETDKEGMEQIQDSIKSN